MQQEVSFFSDHYKIHGDLYLPDDLKPDERRSGIVLIQGFATAKSPPMTAMAEEMVQWGYVVLNFDFRGFGDSEGHKWRMLPLEQVEDSRNAISFLQAHPSVIADSIGVYGASWGGGLAIYTTGIDPRVRCVTTAVPTGNGAELMQSLRRAWEWKEFLKVLAEDRIRRATTGESKIVPRGDILVYEPDVAARMANAPPRPNHCHELPLLTAQAIVDFAPDLMAQRITTQPALFIVCENDARAPAEVSRGMYDNISAPKRWVMLPGAGHDSVYAPPFLERHISEVRDWMATYLPVTGAT